jgi:hypothetical protein
MRMFKMIVVFWFTVFAGLPNGVSVLVEFMMPHKHRFAGRRRCNSAILFIFLIAEDESPLILFNFSNLHFCFGFFNALLHAPWLPA